MSNAIETTNAPQTLREQTIKYLNTDGYVIPPIVQFDEDGNWEYTLNPMFEMKENKVGAGKLFLWADELSEMGEYAPLAATLENEAEYYHRKVNDRHF